MELMSADVLTVRYYTTDSADLSPTHDSVVRGARRSIRSRGQVAAAGGSAVDSGIRCRLGMLS